MALKQRLAMLQRTEEKAQREPIFAELFSMVDGFLAEMRYHRKPDNLRKVLDETTHDFVTGDETPPTASHGQ